MYNSTSGCLLFARRKIVISFTLPQEDDIFAFFAVPVNSSFLSDVHTPSGFYFGFLALYYRYWNLLLMLLSCSLSNCGTFLVLDITKHDYYVT